MRNAPSQIPKKIREKDAKNALSAFKAKLAQNNTTSETPKSRVKNSRWAEIYTANKA